MICRIDDGGHVWRLERALRGVKNGMDDLASMIEYTRDKVANISILRQVFRACNSRSQLINEVSNSYSQLHWSQEIECLDAWQTQQLGIALCHKTY
jgi:hypothetical protein